MAHGGSQPPKYMTVPDKIELTTTTVPGGYDQIGGDNSQRYMKIPDTITLGGGGAAPPQGAARGVASSQATEDRMGQQQAKEEVPRAQPTYDRNQTSHDVVPPDSFTNTAELEQRVRTLEDQVQDILRHQGTPVSSGGINNFWYVLTFASWMLVPLITVYLYRLKK